MSLSQVTNAAIPIELDLSRTNQVEVEWMVDGGYTITTTGGDPWIMSQPIKGSYDPVQDYYVHHRWMDHPQEGGLNLGVRPGKDVPNGSARQSAETVCREMAAFGIACTPDATSKPAWDIYRILATPEQGRAVNWAKTIIPAGDLEYIPYPFEESK